MPKTKISEFDAVPANNTDINGINIAEGMLPSDVNNAIRTLMSDLKDLQAGTSGDTIPIAAGGTGATTASAARTALGATTTGNSLFTAVDAAAARTAIGAGTSSTTGTVTSVGGTGTVNGLTLTGTVTSTGNLTLGGTLAIAATQVTSGTLAVARGGTGAATLAGANIAVTNAANTFSTNQVVSVTDNTNAALRITQLGTGNAILVEDAANPDATPFVVDASGNVISGKTTAQSLVSATPQVQLHSTTASPIWDSYSNFNWSVSNQAAGIVLAKSRSGTIGTNGVVTSADNIGVVGFYGDDGTSFINAAQITAAVDGTPGTNDMPGRLVFSTTADGASSPTERLRIASTGAIGLSGANYGTSGQVLTSAGSGAAPTWGSASAGAKSADVQTFTSSGTWTKPSGFGAKARVYIQAWGGGGSGGREASYASGGGGGGYNERWINLSSLGATETITIGAGGTGKTTNVAGTAGGNSTVGSLLTSYGGGGGTSGATGYGGGGGGQLSAGSSTDGSAGRPGSVLSSSATQTPEGAGGMSARVVGIDGFFKGGGGGYGGDAGYGANSGGGGASVWGGGGGGGMAGNYITTTTGGTSSFAGNGGAGNKTTSGVAGTAPGGGGGATRTGTTSGAGAAGQVIITIFDGA